MADISDRVLLPTDLIPSHYSLEITPNFSSFTFSVNETIVVTVRGDSEAKVAGLRSFSLHARDINIISCSFQGNDAVEINYNKKLNTVSFVFENDFVSGQHEVAIKYEGILNSDMAGFYRCMCIIVCFFSFY